MLPTEEPSRITSSPDTDMHMRLPCICMHELGGKLACPPAWLDSVAAAVPRLDGRERGVCGSGLLTSPAAGSREPGADGSMTSI